jgi:hypothetical protein
MRCAPGVSAYVIKVMPDHQDALGRVVEVLSWSDRFQRWVVRFEGLVPESLRGFDAFAARDEFLLPISGVPLDDETPVETNVPEALKLALGIESRSCA